VIERWQARWSEVCVVLGIGPDAVRGPAVALASRHGHCGPAQELLPALDSGADVAVSSGAGAPRHVPGPGGVRGGSGARVREAGVRCLLEVRDPVPRVCPAQMSRVRGRIADRVFLKTAGLLPQLRRSPHGGNGGASGGSRAAPRTRAAMGADPADGLTVPCGLPPRAVERDPGAVPAHGVRLAAEEGQGRGRGRWAGGGRHRHPARGWERERESSLSLSRARRRLRAPRSRVEPQLSRDGPTKARAIWPTC
jgi:hypothetical protein